MPELVEQMYCSQQIVIPPKFPYILKRYCKAAIKTQPYDLLRWSFEYFKALALRRPPPVKLRLEYPVYSTEGGLTRGCLKVLAIQLVGMVEIPIPVLKSAWGGFCLDPHELIRILCLCEVHMRAETVPFLNFIAVAAGLLTKSLTHTMILICESLTKEPDGGSAAIPVQDFLTAYRFLAAIDASKDVRYFNGYREGEIPEPEAEEEEEQSEETVEEASTITEDFWQVDGTGGQQLLKLTLIDAHIAKTATLCLKSTLPIIGKLERSPSMERLGQIERENYMRERKGPAKRSDDVDQKLKEMREASGVKLDQETGKDAPKKQEVEKKKDGIEIIVYDENDVEIPYEFYGEPTGEEYDGDEYNTVNIDVPTDDAEAEPTEKQKMQLYIAELYGEREERRAHLDFVFAQLAAIVRRYMSANYDLGMVAGRQMSTTSGEFIVQHIEKEIMAYIDDQIAILPDPDLKKKKARPEEVAMVRQLLEDFIDDNMDVIVPEIEEVEEEETPIPEIVVVYAVPGIGASVEESIREDFEKYAHEVCKVQADFFMPRNIRHFLCPPLEKYVEIDYEAQSMKKKKEEVPTGGAITD